jgi:serine phosphatase RsbU (regulator of sigma subunit)
MRYSRPLRSIAAVVLLAAAFACDLVTGSEVASSLFYVIAILFGAWFVSARAGRVLALASVVCWWLAYRLEGRPDPSTTGAPHASTLYWNLLIELAIYLIVAVTTAQARSALERLRSTAHELAVARDALDRESRAVGALQREMLPSGTPDVPGYAFDTTYLTSTRAGGDYYDFVRAPNGRIGIVVADATGHGAPAAVLMAMFRVLLHTAPVGDLPGGLAVPGSPAPEALLARLNAQLVGTLVPGRFVTACVAWLDPATGQLDYSLAGHPPPLLVRHASHAVVQLEQRGGPPLGLLASPEFERGSAQLEPGDTLVLHTDGITEAMDFHHALFGEQRFQEALARANGAGPATMRESVLAALDAHRHGAPLEDDLSLLLLRRCGSAA